MYHARQSKNIRRLRKNLARSRMVLLQFGLMIDQAFRAPIEAQRFHSAYLTGGAGLVAELKHDREEQRLRETLRQLRRRQFIEIRKRGDRIWYVLTKKGLSASLRERMRAAPSLRGGICIVSFDVPEQTHLIRRQLVYLLKDMGFQMVQKSVWMSTKDISVLMVQLIRDMRAEKWVHVYDAKRRA